MKHFFTFLFILLGLCASTSVLAYDFEVDGLLYLKVWGSDTEVEVTCDYRNPYTMSVINIPSSVVYEGKTYKVTEINRINEGDDNDYIKEIIIPESVTLIKGAAFTKCTALTSIVIPDNVTEAHGGIFWDCISLTSVTSFIMNPFPISEVFINELIFPGEEETQHGTFTSATLYVPQGTKELYENTDGWKEFRTIVEIDITGIEDIEGSGRGMVSVYDLNGRKLSAASQRGINILRMDDGTTRKVIVK